MDEGFYCLGLRGNKQQIPYYLESGHLLWSVAAGTGSKLVQRLFKQICGVAGVQSLSDSL